VQPQIGVPYHAEWFNYDPTDSPPPWQPRRGPVWEDILVHDIPDTSPGPGGAIDTQGRLRTIQVLQNAQLTPALRNYATTDLAYGLWQVKSTCKDQLTSSAIPKASDPRFAPITGTERPAWMDAVPASSLSPDAPVYMMSPGASLFRHICINCHGPKADGKGLQGDALSAASEGRARPANLAGGLFGPDVTHENLIHTFSLGTGSQSIADLWGSRYMAWMTLGGTLQLIPTDVMNQVQATKIFGVGRKNLSKLPLIDTSLTPSANMLNIARSLCAVVLPDISNPGGLPRMRPGTIGPNGGIVGDYFLGLSIDDSPFVTSNGDWEMWMHLCGSLNRQVVRVYRVTQKDGDDTGTFSALYYTDDGTVNPPYRFPSDGHVWDHNMVERTNGVTPDNYYPTCLKDPADLLPGEDVRFPRVSTTDEAYRRFRKTVASVMPICPSEFIKHAELIMWSDVAPTDQQVENLRKWSLGGAINAGMSVFSYLEKADLAHNPIQPYYNECQLLPTPPKSPGSP
jgi:mono/diheme cytochrome c family protein